MNLTEKLEEGIELNLADKLSEEVITALKTLINGNLGTNKGCSLYYEDNCWHYLVDTSGGFQKIKIKKYEYDKNTKLTNMINEVKENVDFFLEIERDEDLFYNIGNQIMVSDTEETLYIRVIPFGIYTEEKIYLKVSDQAYYLFYDKISRSVQLKYDSDFDIEDVTNEFTRSYFDENNYEEHSNNIESMFFDYDIDLAIDSISKLYDIIKQYEPKLRYKEETSDIIKELFEIQKQLKYPIYSNPNADRILSYKYSPEELIKHGCHPEEYDFKACFGIELPDGGGKIALEQICSLALWNQLVSINSADRLLAYYKDVKGIEFNNNNINIFLGLLADKKEDFMDLLKFILRGADLENLSIYDVLRNVNRLLGYNKINSWKGRYSSKLLRKYAVREKSVLNDDVLDSMEMNPTLDNLYRQLNAG